MFRPELGPLIVHTLAVCLARQAFPEVVFVTDNAGAELADALGWEFDNVSRGLEKLDNPGLLHVWALGKLAALLEQEVPHVHVDGDVLLIKPLRASVEAGRLVAQSPDFPHHYRGADMARGFDMLGLEPGGRPYNAGVIGGRDVPLVHDYAHAALALAERLSGLEHVLNGTVSSMLVEQYHLGTFAAKRRASVRTILPEFPTRRQVVLAGYAHLAGAAKRRPYYVTRAEARLRKQFPAAHERFFAGWLGRSSHATGGDSSNGETVFAEAL